MNTKLRLSKREAVPVSWVFTMALLFAICVHTMSPPAHAANGTNSAISTHTSAQEHTQLVEGMSDPVIQRSQAMITELILNDPSLQLDVLLMNHEEFLQFRKRLRDTLSLQSQAVTESVDIAILQLRQESQIELSRITSSSS